VYTVGSHYEYSNSTSRLESTVAIISGITKLPYSTESINSQSLLYTFNVVIKLKHFITFLKDGLGVAWGLIHQIIFNFKFQIGKCHIILVINDLLRHEDAIFNMPYSMYCMYSEY
jgi:hypothetical protein